MTKFGIDGLQRPGWRKKRVDVQVDLMSLLVGKVVQVEMMMKGYAGDESKQTQTTSLPVNVVDMHQCRDMQYAHMCSRVLVFCDVVDVEELRGSCDRYQCNLQHESPIQSS